MPGSEVTATSQMSRESRGVIRKFKYARRPRDHAYLAWIRTLPCLLCGRRLAEAAHLGALALSDRNVRIGKLGRSALGIIAPGRTRSTHSAVDFGTSRYWPRNTVPRLERKLSCDSRAYRRIHTACDC